MIRRLWFLSFFLVVAVMAVQGNALAEEKSEKEKWNSSVGLSLVTASGNNETETFSLTGEAKRKGDGDELEFKAGTFQGKTEGKTTSEYWYSNGKYAYDVSEKTYLFGKTDLEGNRRAGYSTRFVGNAGIGHRLLENKHNLKGEVSPGYISENRLGDKDLDFLSARAFVEYSYKMSEHVKFSQDGEYLHNFQDIGNYRVNTNTALVVAISELLSLKTSVEVKYVNEPPAGSENKDIFTSTSLVFHF